MSALSLATGVSRDAAAVELGAGREIGGSATRGVNWVSSEGREDGPGIGEGSLLLGMSLR